MVNLDEVMDKLLIIEREKYNILLRVLELTEEQHRVILDFDAEKLNELIDSKQVEINSLEKLDKEFTLIIDDIKSVYDIRSLEELTSLNTLKVSELKSMTNNIMKRVQEIKSYEEENRIILEQQKKEYANKIKQINNGKKAEKMYQSNNIVQPFFYDKKTNS